MNAFAPAAVLKGTLWVREWIYADHPAVEKASRRRGSGRKGKITKK